VANYSNDASYGYLNNDFADEDAAEVDTTAADVLLE